MFTHFLTAQNPVYPNVLAELRSGRKTTHWMWFVFPQITGLGHSAMSQKFALHTLEEAQEYLAHPVLGARLREATEAVLAHAGGEGRPGRTAHEIFGSPDDFKFRSSMTLFSRAAPEEPLFARALQAFFWGRGGRSDAGPPLGHTRQQCIHPPVPTFLESNQP